MAEINEEKIRVGITLGDVNGIGPEVILKAVSDPRIAQSATIVVYGHLKVVSFYRKQLNIQEFPYQGIGDTGEASSKKVNIINCWEEDVYIKPGESNSDGGKCAFSALERAVSDLASNKIDVLVTGPINKKSIQAQGFHFPGHTEYLAKYANVDEALMFMVSEGLRVAVVTGHIPLRDVADTLTQDKILSKIREVHKSLQFDFKISRPKIAVLGLNPHAGEHGAIGLEDQEIIKPAIQTARDQGILAFGPYAADGFFGSSAFKEFDGILAMYHDQGLIPFKALTFDAGVNFTAGLPIVRTSPDHGTAFDIAGKNEASELSMLHAIYLACDVYSQRKLQRELESNALETSKDK